MENGKLKIHMEDGSEIVADKVLSAIGRAPNTDSLHLEKAGVKSDPKSGLILVDEYQNTSQEGIYAVGDIVKDGIALTPVAVRAGRILSERLFNNRPNLKMDYSNVATVIFSHPPIGTVGMSETDALKMYGADRVRIYTSKFVNMFYSLMPAD